jgi:8-oxo-dGTP diphosphatase
MEAVSGETLATERPAPRVGVGVLVIDEAERVLLSLRRNPPEIGSWSILGGRLESLERLEDCARREAREEAGIDVELVGLLCVTDHILPDEQQHWVSPAYLARIVEGDVENREPEKTAELRWCSLDALPQPLTVTAARAIAALRTATTRT